MLTIAVEGTSDEAIIRRICASLNIPIGDVYGFRGKNYLDTCLAGYNNAANYAPWLILRDLDNDADCAPDLCRILLPSPAPMMSLRIVVRSIEAWLMADQDHLAQYLGISRQRIPSNPEGIDNPKQFLVNLARRSRKRDIIQDMVPQPGISNSVGPGYNLRLTEFSANYWDPMLAAKNADSLQRCIDALQRLARLMK